MGHPLHAHVRHLSITPLVIIVARDARPKPPALAKLTRPRLRGVVGRERLFAQLDQARDAQQAICVVGPPGAGKTTLVAGWLEARRARTLWFQVDDADADLPTFFHYLALAAQDFGGKRAPVLPPLTPDFQTDVRRFSRHYFRSLYARLPAGSVLVLDNYQEIAPEHAFHGLIADALDDMPGQVTVVVVSRQDPPGCYARLVANERVASLGGPDLKLTPEEARAALRARGVVDPGEIEAITRGSEGWAAGLTLLSEHVRRGGRLPATGNERDLPGVFGYFAHQIFEGLPETVRHRLLLLAIPPVLTRPMAADLCDAPDAAALLDDLHRQRLFTHRREGRTAADTTYQFHTLFREFLLARGASVLSDAQRRATAERAADILEARGELDHAVSLWALGQDWDRIAELVKRHGRDLFETGRSAVLRDWITRLPQESCSADPWLAYWLAVAISVEAPSRALSQLASCHDQFAARGDTRGRLEAAQAVVETAWIHRDADESVERWVDVIDETLDGVIPHMTTAEQARAWITTTSLFYWRRPGHPRVFEGFAWLEQAFFSAPLADHARLHIAGLLAYKCWWSSDRELLQRLESELAPALASGSGSPEVRGIWFTGHGTALLSQLRLEEARAELEAAMGLASEYGSPGAQAYVLNTLVALEVVAGRPQVAEAHQARIERASRDAGATAQAHAHVSRQAVLDAKGPLDQALAGLVANAPGAHRSGYVVLARIFDTQAAALLALAGRYEEAHALADQCREVWRRMRFKIFSDLCDLVDAYLHWKRSGWDAALPALEKVLDGIERDGCPGTLCQAGKPLLQALCAEALARSFQPERVRGTIGWLRVAPPEPMHPGWVWPVRIHLLGTREIVVDGKRVTFEGRKPPRKPLALLGVIVCLGGTAVSQERIQDILWPELDGASADHAFRMALHRLRTLIGSASAIRAEDGFVGLDLDQIWVDLLAFQHYAQRAAIGDDAGEAQALALYRGPPSLPEVPSGLAHASAEKAAARFRDLVGARALRFEQAGDWASALHTYEQGLEADAASEPLHGGRMRCLFELGRGAEAITTYRAMRRALRLAPGGAPSREILRVLHTYSPDTQP